MLMVSLRPFGALILYVAPMRHSGRASAGRGVSKVISSFAMMCSLVVGTGAIPLHSQDRGVAVPFQQGDMVTSERLRCRCSGRFLHAQHAPHHVIGAAGVGTFR